jgi:deoxyribose-phosphate aldolase
VGLRGDAWDTRAPGAKAVPEVLDGARPRAMVPRGRTHYLLRLHRGGAAAGDERHTRERMTMATATQNKLMAVPAGDAPDAAHDAHRNPGTPLDLDWVEAVRVNRSAVERRTATIPARRTVKKQWQAAWLLRAITLMDLTTLSGDDTPGTVRRLCAKARHPVRADLLEALGAGALPIHTAAVCVYHTLVEPAVEALRGSGIPVAAVSTGFPAGLSPMPQRVAEIHASVDAGAEEIDVVITRAHVLTGNWHALYDEVRAFRDACGPAHLKTILATGELGTLRNVARASHVCMMAGADFIKTSTGKEAANATLPVGLVMVRAIREYRERTGHAVGFKPAGGIRTAKQSLDWMLMMKEELGVEYLRPDRFRFGASSLLTDIERQLEHHVTGRYAAAHRQPMA